MSIRIKNYDFSSTSSYYSYLGSVPGWTSTGIISNAGVLIGHGIGDTTWYTYSPGFNFIGVQQASGNQIFSIKQTITLSAGTAYLSFLIAPRRSPYYNNYQTMAASLVSATNGTLTFVTGLGSFTQGSAFQLKTYKGTVPANGSYDLTFTFSTNSTGNFDSTIILANISLLQQDIIQNYDFSNQVVATGGYSVVSSVTGWTKSGTLANLMIVNGKGYDLFYSYATDFQYLAVQQNTASTATLKQTLNLVAGRTTIKFMVAPRFGIYYSTGQTLSFELSSSSFTSGRYGISFVSGLYDTLFTEMSHTMVIPRDGSYDLNFIFTNNASSVDTSIMITNIVVIPTEKTGMMINNADSGNEFLDVVDVWDASPSLVLDSATELGFVAYDNLDLARKFVLYSTIVSNGATGVTGTNCNLMDSTGNDIGPKFVKYGTIAYLPVSVTSGSVTSITSTTNGKVYIFENNATIIFRNTNKNIIIYAIGQGGWSSISGGGAGQVTTTSPLYNNTVDTLELIIGKPSNSSTTTPTAGTIVKNNSVNYLTATYGANAITSLGGTSGSGYAGTSTYYYTLTNRTYYGAGGGSTGIGTNNDSNGSKGGPGLTISFDNGSFTGTYASGGNGYPSTYTRYNTYGSGGNGIAPGDTINPGITGAVIIYVPN